MIILYIYIHMAYIHMPYVCIYIYMLSFFRSHCGSRFLLTFICFVVWALSAQDVTQVTLQTLSVHCHIRGGGLCGRCPAGIRHRAPPPLCGSPHEGGGSFFFPHTWSNPHEKKYCHIKGGGMWRNPGGNWKAVGGETGRQPHWNNKHKL